MGDFEQASQWANAIAGMDFTIKNMKCIPNKLISTTGCYRIDREKVYAVIRNAGVLMYEKKGMISFCPEDHRDSRMTMK